jgi:uncharacterized protein (TIGR02271 family)
VFDNRSDAQNAMDELLASGFTRTDVNVSSADPTGQTNSLTGVSERTGEAHEEGIGASIKHFFTSLFGSDNDEHVSRYSDVVSRGHHVLTLVTQSEPEVERAADIVERFGPVDIDERHDLTGSAASLDPAMLAAGASSGSGVQKSSPMSAQSGSTGSSSYSTGSLSGETGERNSFGTQDLNDPVPKGQTFQEPMGGTMRAGDSLQAGGSSDTNIGGNTLDTSTGRTLQSGSGSSLQGSQSLQGSRDDSLGGTIQTGSMQRDMGEQLNEQRSTAIPVVQEDLQVGKREVQRGGVRVFSRVVETPVNESLNLREEHVSVERRPVDQPISPSDATAFKEQSVELRETAEVPVVQKTARVVEEVLVAKEVTQRQENIQDTVRRTEVEVENLGADRTSMRGSSMDDDSYFRQDWQTNYSSLGGSYDDYAPAYRYGSQMRSDTRYRNRNWDDVESDLRSDWDSRYGSSGSSTWEKMKAAVRRGWDKVTPDSDSDDSYYRSHWTSNYGSTGDSYNDYDPAYRYGTQMRSDPRYQNRNWDDVESDLRSDWDSRYSRGGVSTWERMKAAVRHGWDKIAH